MARLFKSLQKTSREATQVATLRQIGKTRNPANFEKVAEKLQAAVIDAVAILRAALFDGLPLTPIHAAVTVRL
ncbi:MAG: hypothetical protein WCA22_07455 [Candidatus Binatus sp.]